MSSLLARFAEHSFWMARYMQRVENLARILDVNETFARDANGEKEWLPILHLHQDEDLFAENYRIVDGSRVIQFYTIDENNPNSMRNCVAFARANARSIRHLLSLETWVQINVFHNWMRKLSTRSVRMAEFSRLCSRIKDDCELHFGIVESTLYRDQVWLFYQLGKCIELCDQSTRLVDIKYHALLPEALDVGTPIDVSQWNALLRSASAYHGYRRVFPQGMTPASVAGFILLDPKFPRSITSCVSQISETLETLRTRELPKGVQYPNAQLSELEVLASYTIEQAVNYGLHEYIDSVQIALINLSEEIAEAYFS